MWARRVAISFLGGHAAVVCDCRGPPGAAVVISYLGVFLNTPGVFLNTIRCTLRRAPRGRPGRAGWLPRCVRTDGRVEVCAKLVPTLVVGPRTFVECVLKEQHSHQTFSQWRRHRSDGQSGLPSTALDHVRATERSAMSPPRPWVSVGTTHDQNASDWHPAFGGVERAIRQLIIGISHRIGASCPSEPTRNA